MQIVIDIPEDLYKAAVNGLDANEIWDLRLVVANGVLLPKGHGRLIDADKLISSVCGSSCGCHLEECGFDIPCDSVIKINSALTIIEADRG